ncbi:hypothetical protein Zmor_001081 [Zophobas morio]|uniref:Uncharacterized protein n=1 Tax=Zophobas morio TaxID=2755281 RepID=A0AA38J0F4_9CUCU|nr:hypothetical protein Zmor_001081 [Zophobas morio]
MLVLALAHAREEEINEINPPRKPPVNLDANLRQALLKALTELENEENQKKQTQGPLLHIDTRDKIVEKASASALSFFASTDSSPTEKQTTTEESTAKSIVLIQQSLQQKPINTLEKYRVDSKNEHEHILTSATSSFSSSSNKFSHSKTENQNPNALSSVTKTTTKLSKAPKAETTTVRITTSTEESEAKVEDVQFFSAPLVAAFTVHQDERGLPKSVEPIYRTVQKAEQKLKEQKFEALTTQRPFSQQQQEQFRTQLALQDKQRALEAEILKLKQQQQQQNYLIRQQQILHQQQLQLQKQKILDEQARIIQTQQPFLPTQQSFLPTQQPFLPTISSFEPTTQRNVVFNSDNSRVKGSLVSFQPSISFTSHQHPSGVLPLNAQQLPVKTAIDFRSPFASTSNFQQFNYLSHQQPPLENSVSTFNLVPTVEPQLTLTAPKHHRVFRQEATTGNYLNNGFNSFNNFNRFNQAVPSHPNSNRFFRSSVETIKSLPFGFNQAQPPVVNQQLNHLLYNSGFIRGKQQEDLNIVSKVLALNHYGGDYRFDSSNVNEQRVAAPVIKKV